ncbi:MAG: protocatechuate 3,4-dioxygenase [Candidatus Krumholzibacteriia bacterium]
MSGLNVLLLIVIALTPGDYAPPEGIELTWQAALAGEDEPGERMIVSGTVFAADGKTAIKGAVVYAYHTDVRGYYSAEERGPSNPRLKGWMKTGGDGRYELSSVRPGPYPEGNIAAHVHFFVTPPGRKEQLFELLFEGDPLLPDDIEERANRGGYYLLQALERDDGGVWRCTADIVLRP